MIRFLFILLVVAAFAVMPLVQADSDRVAYCHDTGNGIVKIVASRNSSHAEHGDLELPFLYGVCVGFY